MKKILTILGFFTFAIVTLFNATPTQAYNIADLYVFVGKVAPDGNSIVPFANQRVTMTDTTSPYCTILPQKKCVSVNFTDSRGFAYFRADVRTKETFASDGVKFVLNDISWGTSCVFTRNRLISSYLLSTCSLFVK